MTRLAPLLVVLASLTLTASAQADTDVTNTPQAQQMLAEAQWYWQRQPPCASYRIIVTQEITDLGKENGLPPLGEAATPGCSMIVSAFAWEAGTPALLCALATHEYGHSLGEPHNTDPYSVMNPAATFTLGRPSDCNELEEAEVAKQQAEVRHGAREEAQERRRRRHRRHSRSRRVVPISTSGH